jgi:very-short-patch-repair endonuclease
MSVGVDAESVMKMIRVHLGGVPNKELYDGQTSIYEFAQIAFGGMIRLVEHFRCAPDIIAFSNRLSYKGEIKPLREEASIKLRPHVVPYRVAGGVSSEGNVNTAEAEVIASLICATIVQPEFASNEFGHPVTFGAVCLVGDNQALAIERLLLEHLPPEEYKRRQIICGNPAHFQGDERDIMFLSLVDAPGDGGPLPMRDGDAHQRLFKKRFNVAASRARNQMWVVYSLDHEIDLKSGDIRRLLIEHALDPKAWIRELESRMSKTESPFEEEVLRRLMESRYDVRPQYQVGAYRIDLVVSGNGKRLAVECDGERFHGSDKLQEDMERQAILERLGWQFVRVRGSLFYRDRERAMADVFQRLEEMGIQPELDTGPRTDVIDDDPLVERIKRRAQEIRIEWTHPGEDN